MEILTYQNSKIVYSKFIFISVKPANLTQRIKKAQKVQNDIYLLCVILCFDLPGKQT